MPDTRRDLSDLQALLANNISGDVSAQDGRDWLVSTELKNLVTKTGNYTADADDQTILLDGTSATVAITLPTAVGILGKRYTLKCVDKTNACTIETNGAQTIDGGANYTFASVDDSIIIESDNANWHIVASDLVVVTAKIATDAVETIKIKDLNVTFAKLAQAAVRQIMPVGSVIAWTDHITGTPSLPTGWKLCDGTAISDAGSPMNGETVPDLNGDERFLRGSGTSGTEQADAFQGHFHNAVDAASSGGSFANGIDFLGVGGYNERDIGLVKLPITDGTNGTPRTASETRPINMSVKWIIRIK